MNKNHIPLSHEDKLFLGRAAQEIKKRKLLDKSTRNNAELLKAAKKLRLGTTYEKLRHPQAYFVFWACEDIIECFDHLEIVANSVHEFIEYTTDFERGIIRPAHYILGATYGRVKAAKIVEGFSVETTFDSHELIVQSAKKELEAALLSLKNIIPANKTPKEALEYLGSRLPKKVENLVLESYCVVTALFKESYGPQDS